MERVLRAARELIAERGGIEPLTMTALAERAEMSLPALYRYFPDRAAVVRELALEALVSDREAVRQGAAGAVPAPLSETVRALLDLYWRQHRAQPFRLSLQAAVAADPELSMLDLEDTRANAATLLHNVQAATGREDSDVLLRQLVLINHLAAAAVRLASLSHDEQEADAVIESYVRMVVRTLERSPD